MRWQILALLSGALAAPAGSAVENYTPSKHHSTSSLRNQEHATPNAHVPLERPPLLPAVKWDQPRGDIQKLAPRTEHDLYFSSHGISDPSLRHAFADFHASWTKEVVILDQSSWIENVTCVDGDISIEFAGQRGYDFAKSTWSDNRNFLLATYTNGCGEDPHTRSFYEINDLTYFDGAEMILANVQKELGMEDILDGASLQWGEWEPDDTLTSRSMHKEERRSNASCGAPPAPTIDGFPAVACNDPNFDDDLDDLIGYFDCDEDGFEGCLQNFSPGFTNYTDVDPDVPDAIHFKERSKTLRRRELVRRRLQRRDFFATLGKLIGGAFKKLGGAISGNKKLSKEGDASIKSGLSDIKITPEVKLDIPIDIKAPADKLVQQPWPNSVSLIKKSKKRDVTGSFEAFCVDCHAKGKVNLAGKAEWNAADGVKKLEASVKGNLEAQLAIGLVAEVQLKETLEHEIVRLSIPGFAIPKIIEVGPFVALRATAELGVEMKGKVLTGAKVTIPPFEGVLDLKDPKKSKPLKIEPKFEKIFEAEAQLTATAGISLPVAVGMGVIIAPVNFKKDLEIVEKPTIMGTMKAEINTNGETSSACKGIDWDLKFQNTVYLNALDLERFDLHNFEKPLANGCLSVPGLEASATTTTTPATTSTGASTTEATTTPTTDSTETEPSPTDAAPSTTTDAAGLTTNAADATAAATEGTSTTEAPDSTDAETGTSTLDQTASSSETTAAAPEVKRTVALDTQARVPRLRRQVNNTDVSFNSSAFNFVQDKKNDFTDRQLETGFLKYAFKATDASNATARDPWEMQNEYMDIFSIDNSMRLTLDGSGNIRPIAANYMGTQWVELDGLIWADESERILHYYPDTMAQLGVSRIRGAWQNDMPQTADVVFLGPASTDDPDTPYIYAAVNSQAQPFSLVTCMYAEGPSKLFLVEDVEAGTAMLKEERLRYTVTGGVVEDCVEYPWVVPASAYLSR